MPSDRYGNPLTTASAAAEAAYVQGVDLLLSANAGAEDAFRGAIAADEGFALAHVALARTLQVMGRGKEAREALARTMPLAGGVTEREQSHIAVFEPIIAGNDAAGLEATRAHIRAFPRDAMVLAPSTGVFGLIGFSGKSGRETDQLALLDPLVSHYGDDWWFRTVHAFAEIEVGEKNRALANIERALTLHPRNAHAAHIRAHVHYELGEREPGLRYLEAWCGPYPREAPLHCHISWHVALWSLETGRREAAWNVYRTSLHPGASWGPQINVLTDCASFLFRAELAGEPRRPELWRDLSGYAGQWFPKPGIAFADIHAALSHAMAGDGAALARVVDGARGAAADVVAPMARAFGAYARGDFAGTIGELEPLMAVHERVGGSRAQRDLIEYTLAGALLRAGRIDEVRPLLRQRRPAVAGASLPLAGV